MKATIGDIVALIRRMAMRTVKSDLIFVDATARDAYFASNPSEVESTMTVIIDKNTTPILQYYLGTSTDAYDNTEWQDISGVIKGEQGDKGDAGELSADNLLYVSASSNPAIPLEDQTGTRTYPFSTIQRALDNLGVDDKGVEIVDASTYTEDVIIPSSVRLYAPNAKLIGDVTTGSYVVYIYTLEITGTIDNKENLVGLYSNNGTMILSTGSDEFNLITELAKFNANLEIDEILYFGDATTDNNWRIKRDGVLLNFERLESGTWTVVTTMGQSVTSDKFILKDNSGSIIFLDKDSNIRTLVKPSIDGDGVIVGNSLGRVGFVNNGELKDFKIDTSSIILGTLQSDTSETQSKTEASYAFKVIATGSFINADISLASVILGTTCRFLIESTDGTPLNENVSEFDFLNGDGQVVTDGVNKITFETDFPVIEDYELVIKLYFSSTVLIQGLTTDISDGYGTRFIPYMVVRYYNGEETSMLHTGNVVAGMGVTVVYNEVSDTFTISGESSSITKGGGYFIDRVDTYCDDDDTFYKVSPSSFTEWANSNNMLYNTSSKKFIYTGTGEDLFISLNLTGYPNQNGEYMTYAIYKNGSIIAGAQRTQYLYSYYSRTDFSISCSSYFNTNDYIEIYVMFTDDEITARTRECQLVVRS